MDEELIKSISLIKSSSYRQNILESLGTNIMTPAELAKISGYRLSHVSMYLSDLKEAGLVQCLNEDSKKGRLYQMTELGKKAIKFV
jgi:DNA-binding transcriptional ArsR family regulator